jgi:hypothetical protein
LVTGFGAALTLAGLFLVPTDQMYRWALASDGSPGEKVAWAFDKGQLARNLENEKLQRSTYEARYDACQLKLDTATERRGNEGPRRLRAPGTPSPRRPITERTVIAEKGYGTNSILDMPMINARMNVASSHRCRIEIMQVGRPTQESTLQSDSASQEFVVTGGRIVVRRGKKGFCLANCTCPLEVTVEWTP